MGEERVSAELLGWELSSGLVKVSVLSLAADADGISSA
jgi:hypothetical protein